MSKVLLGATLAASASAWKIVYPGDQVDLIRIDRQEYPMVFKWPEEGFRCGATMVSDRMALTAAHCVTALWDRTDPNLTVKLADGQVYGIQEFRTNECWNFASGGGPYSADIAIMVLDRPIQGAVAGKEYVKTYNTETMESLVGREFILAGWGASGAVNDEGDFDESHHQSQIFHRGYNVINEIVNNMLVYTMDRPQDGGLDLESMGHYGDSGSGALMDVDGEIHIIGVKSNGGPANWGTRHEYVNVGGYHRAWVEANLVSDTRIVAEGCDPNNNVPEVDGGAGVYEECADTNLDSAGNAIGDRDNDACTLYMQNPHWCGGYDTEEFISNDMCCACGGGRSLIDSEGGTGGESGEGGTGGESGEGGTGGESGEDGSGSTIPDDIDCMCMCDNTDLDCWRGCYWCLDEIFGGEDPPEPEPQGIDCEDECLECTFEDMDCWERCHGCLDPHFNETV